MRVSPISLEEPFPSCLPSLTASAHQFTGAIRVRLIEATASALSTDVHPSADGTV